MVYKGRRMPAREAIALAGFEPDFDLGAKDASALINGSTVSLALGVLATHDARRIVKTANISLALSLEAMRGELAAFDPRVHAARPHPGQVRRRAQRAASSIGDFQRCSRGRAPSPSIPTRTRQPGKPARPARAGRLFAALRAAGARPRHARRSAMSRASWTGRSTRRPTTR